MLDKNEPAHQLAYYDPGVGALAPAAARTAVRRTASLLYMRAVGSGLKDNVAEAYQYLMQHWQPGDAIYIFGFSRGAYTARALAGMLLRPGLMRPGSENLLPYAVEKYAVNRDFKADEYEQWARFAKAFCWRTDDEPLFATIKRNDPQQVWQFAVPIAYIGLWTPLKQRDSFAWAICAGRTPNPCPTWHASVTPSRSMNGGDRTANISSNDIRGPRGAVVCRRPRRRRRHLRT